MARSSFDFDVISGPAPSRTPTPPLTETKPPSTGAATSSTPPSSAPAK